MQLPGWWCLRTRSACFVVSDELFNVVLWLAYTADWNKSTVQDWGYAVAQLVEELRHKPESRRFDSWWWHNPSERTVVLGLTQPLIEMSTRDISWGVKEGSADSGRLKLLERYGMTHQRNPAKLDTKSIFTYLHFSALNNFTKEDGRGNVTSCRPRCHSWISDLAHNLFWI